MRPGLRQPGAVFTVRRERGREPGVQLGADLVVGEEHDVLPKEVHRRLALEVAHQHLGPQALRPLLERHDGAGALPGVPVQVDLDDGR